MISVVDKSQWLKTDILSRGRKNKTWRIKIKSEAIINSFAHGRTLYRLRSSSSLFVIVNRSIVASAISYWIERRVRRPHSTWNETNRCCQRSGDQFNVCFAASQQETNNNKGKSIHTFTCTQTRRGRGRGHAACISLFFVCFFPRCFRRVIRFFISSLVCARSVSLSVQLESKIELVSLELFTSEHRLYVA